MRYLLPHLIDAGAADRPDHPAVRCRKDSLDYATLTRRANGLARLLIEDGVRPGERVGIFMPKSVECAVALYGIMKAGAVYVPLDPTAPEERVAFVIGDCGIRRLVAHPRRRRQLDRLVTAGVALDAVFGVDAAEGVAPRSYGWDDLGPAETPPPTRVTEDDLCYILYTSGSTGVPKGIMHTHRSALAWARVSAATYGLGPADRISNYAPLHFDLSTLDYFAGALAQATTVMVPEEHLKLPASLAALIAEERLTLFYTVPFALIQLLLHGALERHEWDALRWVLFGGEPMPVRHLAALMRRWPGARFSNVYGPTETNGCTWYPVPEPPAEGTGALPIGRMYDNAEGIVVDDADEEVAHGELGELLVRAPTSMRGYWGRPDLNEKVFFYRRRYEGLPETFVRTGDLVRLNDAGELEFHGRGDRLVKTRGYRVELDEVEAVLGRHPAVEEAATWAVPDDSGSVLIHAAATLADAGPGPADGGATDESGATESGAAGSGMTGTGTSAADAGDPRTSTGKDVDLVTDELMRHLKSRLPGYAVPVKLDVLPGFPRTTTGKIDRRALQARYEEAS